MGVLNVNLDVTAKAPARNWMDDRTSAGGGASSTIKSEKRIGTIW